MPRTQSPDGKSRILDAAIELFAEHGYAGASVRDIAARAGVTGGLIVHHFGTKAALRDACDRVVVDALVTSKGQLDAARLAGMLSRGEGAPAHMDYLRRMLMDHSERADEVFDRLLDATRSVIADQQRAGVIRADLDAHAVAGALSVYGLAPLLLPRQLARAFGSTELDEATLAAAAGAVQDLLTRGLYDGPAPTGA